MDQLKEFLRQAIKYRFWIAVGLSALLPMIAYAVGSDPIKTKAAAETQTILGAEKGVRQYSSGVVPNDQYKPLVDKEREVLSKDVHTSWEKLYAQQSPLLTWPSNVEERFRAWGRKWPENVDASAVQLAIIDYVTSYPKFVNQIYQTFRPFDTIEGTGVVVAPPESMLLRPSPFTIESPPELGKVWAAQERLWMQRTLLQVIADVNKDAKDWDHALIKQLNQLEVGNSAAQDQVSLGKGQALEEAPALTAPGAPPPTTETAAVNPAMAMMGARQNQPTDSVFYIKSDSTQFKTLPVMLSVLIDQEHIQDLLIALENSPMAVQVTEFEMAKPSTRVTKPQKGEGMNFNNAMAMYQMNAARMMQGQRMTMYGGATPRMMPQMMMSSTGAYAYGGNMGTPPVEQRKGVDKRSENRSAKRKEELERASKTETRSTHDPYYYIVEVTVYGQARFYNPPPVEPVAEPSQSEATPAAPADTAKAETEAEKKAEPSKAEGESAKKDEAAKAEGESAKKDEAAKAEGEPAKKDEAAKAEAGPAKKDEAAKEKSEPAKKDEAAKEKSEPAKKDDAGKPDAEPAKGEASAKK